MLHRLLRSPRVFWTLAVVMALVTGLTSASLLGAARRRSMLYGPLLDVVVASRRVEAGATVASDDMRIVAVPATLVPSGVVDGPGAVLGRTVVVPLLPGLAVLHANLAPDGLKGLAAQLSTGSRAVAIPRDPSSVPTEPGDLVDVLVVGDRYVPPPTATGSVEQYRQGAVVVARAAPVLAVGPEAVTVAVAETEARLVAQALAEGVVTLVVTGAPPTPEAPGRPPPGR